MNLAPLTVSPGELLLDPNNYRFHDLQGWSPFPERRIHEPRVQDQADRYLRNTTAFEVSALKDSIRSNGFVPLEQVVVRTYGHAEGKYVVVEGNRRICAIKWLLEDHASAAVTLSAAQLAALSTIQVLILDVTDPSNTDAVHVIMAIRHVAGIKEWGSYQQARLIVELLEQEGADFQNVGERLGISSREVARRYRASKALQQMEDNAEYGDSVKPTMYSIFHEVVATPAVRNWLGWDEQSVEFRNAQAAADFYSLISGDQAKIKSYEDIRAKLKHIVENPTALAMLLDPAQSLDEAFQAATAEARANAGSADFEAIIRRCITALENLPRLRLRQMSEPQVALLSALHQQIAETLQDVSALRGDQGGRQAG